MAKSKYTAAEKNAYLVGQLGAQMSQSEKLKASMKAGAKKVRDGKKK